MVVNSDSLPTNFDISGLRSFHQGKKYDLRNHKSQNSNTEPQGEFLTKVDELVKKTSFLMVIINQL